MDRPFISNHLVDYTIEAYLRGAFPMAREGRLTYCTCRVRSVYMFDSFHVPRRLKRIYKQNTFELKVDTAFAKVVEACRANREEWISEELLAIFCQLFLRGYAHSFEAWKDGKLVGGVFGTCFGTVFLAESMFHTLPHASNVSLVYLMNCVQISGFEFVDIQYDNEHTRRFNPINIKQESFDEMYSRCVNNPTPKIIAL